MIHYPKARLVPWRYDSPQGPTYFRGTNRPVAVVLHVMQGYASTGAAWALSGHYGASWHFTVGRDGSVMQHLDFQDGGYHAGVPFGVQPAPSWPLYRNTHENVNNYTIGIEHEGFSGTPFTPEQAEASRDLCRWIAAELGVPLDIDHFTWHGAIDLVNRRDDFNTAELRAAHYAYLFAKEEPQMMSAEERNMFRIASGPYEAVGPTYDALVAAGLINEADGPPDDSNALNGAIVRRFRIIEAACINAEACVEAVK